MDNYKVQLTQNVIDAINEELEYQNNIAGTERADEISGGIAAQLLCMHGYTHEAMIKFMKEKGDDAALDNIRKVAATAIRALIIRGCPRRKV